MEIMIIIVGVVFLILCQAIYVMYVRLVKTRNSVKEAMSSVDVQLNKRYDLIPNILTIANKFMEHERELITKITELRAKAVGMNSTNADNINEKINLDNEITSQMGKLMVSMENYPQLKSDNTMVQAMQTYSEVEEHIAAARRFYNSAVKELNNMTEIFPSSLVASALNIRSYPFFEASAAAKQSINASDYFTK